LARKKDEKTAELMSQINSVGKPTAQEVNQVGKATDPIPPEQKEPEMAQKETSLAPASSLDLSDYSPEEMTELQGATGLDDVPESERRPALYSWNLSMQDEHGNPVMPNMFYNGQTGEQFPVVNCALIVLKKTHEFAAYDEQTREKTVYCRSWDRQTGTFLEKVPTDNPKIKNFGGDIGEIRRCDDCKYRQGKRGEKKNCTIVYRLIAWDLDRQNYFIFNVQRSSFVPFNRFLESNFFGQWKSQNGKRRDVPLYLLATRMTLVQEERYFILHPEIATDVYPKGVLPKNLVMDLAVTAREANKIRRQDLETDVKNAKYQQPDSIEPVEREIVDDGDVDGAPF